MTCIARYFERKICNMIIKTQKKTDWFKKTVKLWIDSDFECMTVPVDNNSCQKT